MQPNDQPQFSIDYLEQISSPTKKPGIKDMLFPMIVIAGLIIALLVGLIAILGSGSGNQNDMVRLSLRLKTLQSVTDSSHKTIKNSALRSTNTNLSLFLTNTNRDIKPLLISDGGDTAKANPKIAQEEAGTELKTQLEDARLNAVYDRTYAREMSFQLETVDALMQQIEKDTGSRNLREFLATARSQLEPLRKQFAEFTAASS